MPGLHYGGISEAAFYLKSTQPSPCIRCSRLLGSKLVCSEDCGELLRWQIKAGALNEAIKVQEVRRILRNGNQVCGVDGAALRYEDGVIYCVECRKIYMRIKDTNSLKEVKYLLRCNWNVEQIGGVLGLCEEHVVRLARQCGVSFRRKVELSEKMRIVEYMLVHGADKAAIKFDLHQETVNRYARDLGLGTKLRYGRLREKAAQLFGEGRSVTKVAERLGVHWRTAKKWQNLTVN